jgi:hypothetical protein
MRALIVSSILACLTAGAALAQSDRIPPGPLSAPTEAGPNSKAHGPAARPKSATAPIGTESNTDALASCLDQWERATHMSRQEWGRACRRVADRLQNLKVK